MGLKYSGHPEKVLENWDLSTFFLPEDGDNPSMKALYDGPLGKKHFKGLCNGAVYMARIVMSAAGTSERMDPYWRRAVFQIIAEGVRRRLFSKAQITEVMDILCPPQAEAPPPNTTLH
jgi:hypothetical protein